jgi:NAD(P)-dependent dehydrogenase (short-subunit alcohol dehydrogenase family)
VELVDYLHIVRRRMVLILVITLACVAGAGVATALQTTTYRASVRLIVSGASSVSDVDEIARRQLAVQRAVAFSQIASTPPAVSAALKVADDSGPYSSCASPSVSSSGGMYSQRIDVDDPHTEHRDYVGPAVDSRTKRAQVIVTEMRGAMLADRGVVCHSMHPGWAATPGVSSSIPDFEAKFRDILRTPEQGADTIVWLGAADEPARSTGGFWLDRRVRETHRSDATRETQDERDRLWALCRALTGLDE